MKFSMHSPYRLLPSPAEFSLPPGDQCRKSYGRAAGTTVRQALKQPAGRFVLAPRRVVSVFAPWGAFRIADYFTFCFERLWHDDFGV
jgi:hypothetical protein